jgi:tetratricopeptide (TPR) repeat protein
MQNLNATRLEALVREAARARQSGDFATALAIAGQAAQEHLAHPLLLRLQAEALAVAGRYAEAGQLLNRALALAPSDALTINDIGRVLVAENRVEDAIRAFEAAVTARPGLAAAWLELGSAHEIAGDDNAARTAYERAKSLAPGDAEAWAALATIAMRHGDAVQARSLAEEALRLQADHPGASLVLASTDLDRGSAPEAHARLEELLARKALDERQQQVALGLLGDALDRLGRTGEAFAAYTRMNEETVRVAAPRFDDGGRIESHLEFVQRLTRWFERQDPAAWRPAVAAGAAPSPVRRHVFLLGYPRSGNTLVENVLVSLPGVRSLEERPTLAEADLAFLRDDRGLEQLTHLDPALAARHREAYWRRVRAEVPDLDGQVFVDMAPLNGIKLPMIARLFPDALVVLCRRDPRDVVLSCFRRHFRVNPSTYQMAGLERAARHYDAVMHLVELHLAALPLPVHVVDYARLVADFDATTRALAEFVGVPWTEGAREFSRTAAAREVRTVSAPQVRRGLFDGTRQWERYTEQMAPVLPLLEPWVARFGYASGAGPSASLSGSSQGS